MKYKRIKLGIQASAFGLALIVLMVSSFPAQATNKVSDLEKETNKLESELSNLNQDLNEILAQIEDISTNLEKTKKELAIAKGKEEVQYESMMLRIKYMYENGDFGMMANLLSSSCIAEFLDRAEFMIEITKYDRKQLDELTETRKQIAKQEEQLASDVKTLDALQADLESKIASTSSNLSTYKQQLENAKEEARQAVILAQQQVKPVRPSTGTSSGSSYDGGSYVPTASDIELFAALTECEAGSSNYEGMLAVASVVMNRVKHYKYPNTLRGVILQPNQFPPATNGLVDRVLARGVKTSCVNVAKDALAGKNNIGDCLRFRSVTPTINGIVIGGNVFY